MTRTLPMVLLIGAIAFFYQASATGLATCNSGPQSGWKSEAALKKKLTDGDWKIRRVKIDGGCYEVYAINDKASA